jgi:hypothetical protein
MKHEELTYEELTGTFFLKESAFEEHKTLRDHKEMLKNMPFTVTGIETSYGYEVPLKNVGKSMVTLKGVGMIDFAVRLEQFKDYFRKLDEIETAKNCNSIWD